MQIVADKSHRGTAQKAAGYAFIIRILSAGITYLSQILMARWMGVQEYGIYINVWVYVLLLGYVCNLGFAPASQRIVPEYRETGQDALLRGYLFGSRLFSIGLATAIGATGLLGLYFFGHLMTSHLVIPLYLGMFCLPLFGITDIQDGMSRSYNWTDIALVPTYLVRPLMILLVLAGGHAYGLPANAVTAMGGAIFACWFTGIVQYLALRHRLKGQIRPGPKQFAYRTWFKWSLPLFLAEGSHLMLGYIDVLVLEHYVSPADLAVYWAAAKTLALVSFVYFSVSAATAHRFSEYHVLGDHAKLAQLLSDGMRWTFFPSLVAVLGMLGDGQAAALAVRPAIHGRLYLYRHPLDWPAGAFGDRSFRAFPLDAWPSISVHRHLSRDLSGHSDPVSVACTAIWTCRGCHRQQRGTLSGINLALLHHQMAVGLPGLVLGQVSLIV